MNTEDLPITPDDESGRCCAECSTERTHGEFLENHLLFEEVSTDHGDVCIFCHGQYGYWNPVVQAYDTPVQVDLPTCKHKFGKACLYHCFSCSVWQSIEYMRCPFCDTKWYTTDDRRPAHLDDDEERVYSAEFTPRLVQTDLTTARFLSYKEPELADIVPPITLYTAGKNFRLCAEVLIAIRSDFIRDLIESFYDPLPVLHISDGPHPELELDDS